MRRLVPLLATVFLAACDTATPSLPTASAPRFDKASDEILHVPITGTSLGVWFAPPVFASDGPLDFVLEDSTVDGPYALLTLRNTRVDGSHAVSATVNDSASSTFSVTCRRAGAAVYGFTAISSGDTVLLGTTEEPPTSWHYVVVWIDGQQYTVIEYDYDRIEGDTPGEVSYTSPSGYRGSCSHLSLRPSVPLAWTPAALRVRSPVVPGLTGVLVEPE